MRSASLSRLFIFSLPLFFLWTLTASDPFPEDPEFVGVSPALRRCSTPSSTVGEATAVPVLASSKRKRERKEKEKREKNIRLDYPLYSFSLARWLERSNRGRSCDDLEHVYLKFSSPHTCLFAHCSSPQHPSVGRKIVVTSMFLVVSPHGDSP
jgi:hypothetical protein